MDAVAFEPHEGTSRVSVNLSSSDKPIVLTGEKPYVTDRPAEILALDEAFGVKRVAKGESKREARDKAEAKS